jgi:hypothetical protein
MDSTLLQQPDEIFKCPDVLTHPGFHGGYHFESFLYPRGVVIHVMQAHCIFGGFFTF